MKHGLSRATFKPFRAGKNRFPHPRNQFVRTLSSSVRREIDSCGHFSVRAAIIQSVRARYRSVRANYRSVRAKINPCGHYSIRAEKPPVCGRFLRFQVVKKRQFNRRRRRKESLILKMSLVTSTPTRQQISAVHSGRILFWTVGGHAQALAVRQHPDSLGLAHFRLSRWDERRAKIILRWTFGAFGV
jgi:hypothetical protein